MNDEEKRLAARALELIRAYGRIRRRNFDLLSANRGQEDEVGDQWAEDEALDAIRELADNA